jgi:hypothetical protein
MKSVGRRSTSIISERGWCITAWRNEVKSYSVDLSIANASFARPFLFFGGWERASYVRVNEHSELELGLGVTDANTDESRVRGFQVRFLTVSFSTTSGPTLALRTATCMPSSHASEPCPETERTSNPYRIRIRSLTFEDNSSTRNNNTIKFLDDIRLPDERKVLRDIQYELETRVEQVFQSKCNGLGSLPSRPCYLLNRGIG